MTAQSHSQHVASQRVSSFLSTTHSHFPWLVPPLDDDNHLNMSSFPTRFDHERNSFVGLFSYGMGPATCQYFCLTKRNIITVMKPVLFAGAFALVWHIANKPLNRCHFSHQKPCSELC